MFKISLTSKRLILIMLCIAVVSFGISILFIRDTAGLSAFLKGLIFGTMFAVLKLILMERTINKSLTMGEKLAQGYTVMNYTVRYFLTGAVLAVAAAEPSINFIGTIVGVISLQFAAYLLNIIFRDKKAGIDN